MVPDESPASIASARPVTIEGCSITLTYGNECWSRLGHQSAALAGLRRIANIRKGAAVSCEAGTAAVLRGGGRRLTSQREQVAVALRHAGGHRTAEELTS